MALMARHRHRTRNERGALALGAALLVTSILFIDWSKEALRTAQSEMTIDAVHPPLYLPAASQVKLITLGFNNFASDILWFTTINYFGKHYQGDKDYRWFFHMCDVVTELDARKDFAYEFCGTLLSWEAKEAQLSNAILDKAVETFPQAWRYRYLRGFNNWYFLDDRHAAKRDLEQAARLPDAPPFVAGIASRLIVDRDSIDTAIRFIEDMLQHTTDKSARKSLRNKLKLAQLTKQKQTLHSLIERYEQERGSTVTNLPQLVEAGLIHSIPWDPFGGKFYVNEKTGEIESTSGEKGLEFFGKSAGEGSFKR